MLLDHEGLRYKIHKRTGLVRWQDIKVFGLIYDTRSHRQYVGWRYKDRPANSRYSDEMDKIVGMGFAASPETLRDTLEDWRIRFSQQG